MAAQRIVRVAKNQGESMGIGFNKNSDQQNRVFAILEGSSLHRSKDIIPGDIIMQVNNRDVSHYTSKQLIDVIATLQDETEVTFHIVRPSETLTNGDTPSITIDDVNPHPPPTNTGGRTEGRRPIRRPVVDDHRSKPVHLQPNVEHPASMTKRLSLTPETKHKEIIASANNALQPSKSLDLGALPTWRSKTFVNLHNYWTGEQQSDRLHTQSTPIVSLYHTHIH